MASGSFYFDISSSSQGMIEWSSITNQSNNSSTVNAILYIKRHDGYSTTGTFTGTISIDGHQTSYSKHLTLGTEFQEIGRLENITVPHNEDGTKTCLISATVENTGTSLAGTYQGSENITLETIARHLNITKFVIQGVSLDNLNISWETDARRDVTEYSINNGEWIGSAKYDEYVHSNNQIGNFFVRELAPNTTYEIRIRFRREGNGLYTISETKTITTPDIAKINGLANFTHGDNADVSILNPSNETIRLDMKINNELIVSQNANSGRNIISFTDEQLDKIYKKYGNNNSVTANFIVTTADKYTSTENCIIELKGNQKTINIKVNNNWKRGKIFTKINGSWKKSIIWKKVDGVWRRCI